jgi:RNA 2',3'-cyclic 3'-phosphodiesterase
MLFTVMRLFTGIPIDERVVNNLQQALAPLRVIAGLRWSPPENFHITSRFIGQWPDNRLAEVQGALRRIDPPGKLDVAISHLGFFPNPHHPRVFFAGVHSGPGLAELAKRINAALEPLGLPPEDTPYSPHLTLARIGKDDSRQSVRRLREYVASMANFDCGSFVAESFALFLSKPGRVGSVYTRLTEYSLCSAA